MFPHKRNSIDAHTTYLRNLLRVLAYAPELRESVMMAVVGKCIALDVEIKLDDFEDEDEEPSQVIVAWLAH